MDKQKQTEEMANILNKYICNGSDDNAGCCFCRSAQGTCVSCKEIVMLSNKNTAQILVEEGYQRVEQGKWISEMRERCDWRGKKQKYFQPNSCSKCHEPVIERTPYCPNCGAKMKGE